MNKSFDKAQASHESKMFNEWDEQCDREDKRQAEIDQRVSDMWLDADCVEEALAEKGAVITVLLMKLESGAVSRDDFAESVLSTIDHELTCTVEYEI